MFCAPCSYVEGAGRWVGIWGHGGVPRQVHIHVHACTCTHTHVYMYKNCKWLPTWRHPCLSCLTCMCVCACVHACMHVCACACMCAWDIPHIPIPTPTPVHPPATPPPPRDPRSSKNSITLELIKIFQFHLKI